MKSLPALLAVLAVSACATAPQPPQRPAGVTDADLALFRSAVAQAGCRVGGPREAEIVEARTGFEDNKLRAITEYLAASGEMRETSPLGFVLTSGPCAVTA
ncbi:hypothetical protein [Histidinibacterium aquaticum]|uniref:NADH dehydrogenase n=1 Tax=Histidinibacterium aquaticum TaxID=2613962 RepID=A0A5J5GQS0_9RHOB|nr:hypothetical protein [Histidinibacterium aquaticum]KAA9009742.1 hypothetical protein F3S47_00255 [Histidinibacterium aquaticum]